jgi:hypothetical protein
MTGYDGRTGTRNFSTHWLQSQQAELKTRAGALCVGLRSGHQHYAKLPRSFRRLVALFHSSDSPAAKNISPDFVDATIQKPELV